MSYWKPHITGCKPSNLHHVVWYSNWMCVNPNWWQELVQFTIQQSILYRKCGNIVYITARIPSSGGMALDGYLPWHRRASGVYIARRSRWHYWYSYGVHRCNRCHQRIRWSSTRDTTKGNWHPSVSFINYRSNSGVSPGGYQTTHLMHWGKREPFQTKDKYTILMLMWKDLSSRSRRRKWPYATISGQALLLLRRGPRRKRVRISVWHQQERKIRANWPLPIAPPVPGGVHACEHALPPHPPTSAPGLPDIRQSSFRQKVWAGR